MSEFRQPPMVVDYNQLWLSVDMRGDREGWAWHATAELLARPRWRAYRSARGEKKVTALLEQAAAISQRRVDASMGFLLIPSPEEGVKGMVAFCPVDLAGREGADAWETLLAELAPELPGDGPPEVVRMETRAGECRRLRLRYAAGDGPERPVGEHIGYLWVFGAYGSGVIATISFPSMLEAARWLPALDDLAKDVWLEEPGGDLEPSR